MLFTSCSITSLAYERTMNAKGKEERRKNKILPSPFLSLGDLFRVSASGVSGCVRIERKGVVEANESYHGGRILGYTPLSRPDLLN